MTLSKQQFLTTSGLRVHTLELWLEQQWLIPVETTDDGATFSDVDVARARLILNLKDDFGINDEGIDVILHLLDQLHGARQAMAVLRAAGTDRPGDA